MTLSDLRKRFGILEGKGLPSFCTANEFALKAILDFSALHQLPVLIEATCNQVNQEGGYTGMKPADFAAWIADLAKSAGVTTEQLLLGGDHLGPNPWNREPAETAMRKAEILVKDYVEAGFVKIHIDTSMACGNEATPSFELVAERAARLCLVAEKYAPNAEDLCYVIGTEVPIPGGETDDTHELSVTTTDRLRKTINTHKDAFSKVGLEDIWSRVVSIVTQPGVDFSHTSVHRFKPDEAKELAEAITREPGLSFEAHSTDYQPNQALEELIEKHFAFLKVGPELTFRMREAAFSLAQIENTLKPKEPANLISVIDKVMDEKPAYWSAYYQGNPSLVAQLRHYSFSDRVRYYWANPDVKSSLEKLIYNLEAIKIPETLVSQYFPTRGFGELKAEPQQLISDHIKLCVQRYYESCGFTTE